MKRDKCVCVCVCVMVCGCYGVSAVCGIYFEPLLQANLSD